MSRIAIIEKIDDEKAKVVAHRPDSGDKKDKEIEIDDLPERPQEVGKSAILYCNPKTGETWFEQKDRPLTPEEIESKEGQEKIEDELITDMTERGVL